MPKVKKTKKPFYKRWWVIAISVFLAIGFIGVIFESDESKAERAAEEVALEEKRESDKAAEAAAKKEKEAEEKASKDEADSEEAARIDGIISKYGEASSVWIDESNEIILSSDIKYNSNHFKVRVFVEELTWAASSESEKMSFATTIGNAVQNTVGGSENVYVDIMSADNQDVLATQKLFGGWKIKR